MSELKPELRTSVTPHPYSYHLLVSWLIGWYFGFDHLNIGLHLYYYQVCILFVFFNFLHSTRDLVFHDHWCTKFLVLPVSCHVQIWLPRHLYGEKLGQAWSKTDFCRISYSDPSAIHLSSSSTLYTITKQHHTSDYPFF